MARRIRSQEYNGNTFFTSSLGVLKSELPTSQYKPAGEPRGLDLTLAIAADSNWFATNTSVAYRLVWGIRDLNNNFVYGPPSDRTIITNAGAAGSVRIGFTIPAFISVSNFFQIYRSKAVASGIDPGDELQLVYERNPTAAEIAALAVAPAAVQDITPEELLAIPLYTNATQEGIIQSNTSPPYCRDLCLYKDYVIYANTKIRQNLNINLIGTFDPAVLVGQTITIDGVTYSAAAAENIAAAQFLMTILGATPSININDSARSLVRVINGFAGNSGVYAFYVSDFGDVPGKIYLESRNLGDAPWTVTVTAGFSKFWEPQLPVTATAQFTSSDDNAPNRIILSKFQQPEHVPYINNFNIGAKNEAIQRVIALRDSVIIWKDNSIWRMVGSSLNNFQVTLLDNTVSITSRDSVSVLNNMAYGLTNQGFVAVSDNGVQILSRSIETDILANVRFMQNAGTQDDTVGIGQESDRMYYCTMPAVADGNIFTAGQRITYAYNAFSQAWTRTYFNANCYAVLEDRIYFGLNNNFGEILEQRIGYADETATFPAEMEMADPEGDLNVSNVNAGLNQITATFTDGVNWTNSISSWPTTPQRGWIILDQANSKKYIILNVVGNVYTLNTTAGLVIQHYTVYRSIQMRCILSPRSYGEPFLLKQFSESQYDLGTMSAYEFDTYFYNEEDQLDEPVSTFFTQQTAQTRIALNDFNTATLNANYIPHNIKRTYVNKERSIGTRLLVEIINKVAGSRFDVNAVGLQSRLTRSSKVSQ